MPGRGIPAPAGHRSVGGRSRPSAGPVSCVLVRMLLASLALSLAISAGSEQVGGAAALPASLAPRCCLVLLLPDTLTLGTLIPQVPDQIRASRLHGRQATRRMTHSTLALSGREKYRACGHIPMLWLYSHSWVASSSVHVATGTHYDVGLGDME